MRRASGVFVPEARAWAGGVSSILLVKLLCGCAGQPAPATQEVRRQVEKTMRAFAAMDLEGFKAGLADDVVGYEMDLESKPVRLGSREDAVRFAEGVFGQMKQMGAKMELDFHATDCRAAPALSYCTVEFDFKATMLDGSTMLQPSRNTIVLRNQGDGWKWVHWHSSLAKAPPPPAPSGAH